MIEGGIKGERGGGNREIERKRNRILEGERDREMGGRGRKREKGG